MSVGAEELAEAKRNERWSGGIRINFIKNSENYIVSQLPNFRLHFRLHCLHDALEPHVLRIFKPSTGLILVIPSRVSPYVY